MAEASRILVDSSVWMDYYRPRGAASLKAKVQEALREGKIVTLGLIAVEVLQGAPNLSILSQLEEDFLGLHWLELIQEIWLEAARLGAKLRQAGASVPAIDIVISSAALHYGCTLWHQDEDFSRLKRHVPSLKSEHLSPSSQSS